MHHPFKVVSYIIGAIVILCVIALLALPMFLSHAPGKNILTRMVRGRTGVKVEIQNLSLSWFGPQVAKGISGSKPEEELTFTCQEITTDASLWGLMFKNEIGHMQVIAPLVQMSKPFQMAPPVAKKIQTASLAAALPEVKMGRAAYSLPIKGQVVVEQGKVTFNPPDFEPIVFDDLALSLDLPGKEEIALKMSCTANQGSLAIKAAASHLDTPIPDISIQSTISKLPVQGVDQMISVFYPEFRGLFYSAVGPSLDLQCHFQCSQGNFDLSLDAQSSLLTASIATQSTDDRISLKNPAAVNFNLTPTFLNKILAFFPSVQGIALTQPALIKVTLSRLSFPLDDWRQMSFQVALSAPPQIGLSLNGKPVDLSNLNVQCSSPMLREQVLIDAATNLQYLGQTGSLSINGNTKNLTVNGVKFPVDLTGLPLSNFLGASADFTALLDLKDNPRFHLSWNSPLLNLPSLDLALNDSWRLISPAEFSLRLNPKFVQSAPIQGTIQDIDIPAGNVQNTHFNVGFSMKSLSISNPVPLSLTKVKGELSMKTLDQVSLEIFSDTLSVSLTGAYNLQTQEFVLTKPLAAEYNLPHFATLQLTLNPMTFPTQTTYKGQLFCPKYTQDAIALLNTTIPFEWDSKNQSAVLQFTSQVQNPVGAPGTVKGDCTFKDLIDPAISVVQASIDLQNIATELLESMTGKTGIKAIAGPRFSSKLRLQSDPNKQQAAVKWASANLNADAAFLIQGNRLQIQGNNNKITWTMTPEGYEALDVLITGPKKGMIPFELKDSSTFTLSLTKMDFPVTPKAQINALVDRIPDIIIDIHSMEIAATGSDSSLNIYDKLSQETIELSGMHFSIEKTANQGPLSGSLNCHVVQSGKTGSLNFKGTLEPTSDLSQLSCKVNFDVQQFPSRALDIFARSQGRTDLPFTTTFGNLINATMSLDLNNFSGPVSLNLNTPQARASLTGTFANGVFIPNDTIHAQMKITTEFSRLLFKEINPLNLSYMYSDAPITLEIPSNGVNLPIYPFTTSKITIPKAKIELGQITCRNEGNVGITLGLLQSKQEKNKDLVLWFAPVDLSIKQGITNIERTEILLANTHDICIWGNIDLTKKYVDMVLGLTASTLKKAFGIKNLPDNYVLTLPMKGPMNNVQINTKKATAKMALLLAWQKANVADALGGTPGALLGGFLNKVATLPDSNANVPPAKRPFPWESQTQQNKKKTSSTSHEKKRRFKQNDKPLKQILKVIR